MSKDDRPRVVAYDCARSDRPLILATDEADVVDGLCPCRVGIGGCQEEGACDCDKWQLEHGTEGLPDCSWKGHDHARKLRGLKNEGN